MKNTIRCCISCILPCGALDVIRIVHSNGRVEEISGSIRASEVMKTHPKHVLKKPSSPSSDDDDAASLVPKIVVVPPDAQLQRGKIYFLMPLPSDPPEKSRSRSSSSKRTRDDTHNHHRRHRRQGSHGTTTNNGGGRNRDDRNNSIADGSNINLLVSDQYLSEILSEKMSTQRDRRRGRIGVWRPHLESISETPFD